MSAELERFLRSELDPRHFHHIDHVRVAVELLQMVPFSAAVGPFPRGLQYVAAAAGDSAAFNETMRWRFYR